MGSSQGVAEAIFPIFGAGHMDIKCRRKQELRMLPHPSQ
jgi:hypothetical protein